MIVQLKKQLKERRESEEVMESGSDITFGTILEEDYQAMHAAEDRQKQKSMAKVNPTPSVPP